MHNTIDSEHNKASIWRLSDEKPIPAILAEQVLHHHLNLQWLLPDLTTPNLHSFNPGPDNRREVLDGSGLLHPHLPDPNLHPYELYQGDRPGEFVI